MLRETLQQEAIADYLPPSPLIGEGDKIYKKE
jgi:hypothetical protein